MAGAGYLIRGAWRMSGRVHQLADDLLGDQRRGRMGVVARLDGLDSRVAGLDERLGTVEHQVCPNSGSSLHDKVTRVAEAVAPETT
jgi:hypothetical protein